MRLYAKSVAHDVSNLLQMLVDSLEAKSKTYDVIMPATRIFKEHKSLHSVIM